MKRVLLIAYHFPPERTAGIYRPVKFAKYLPEFNWDPVILTVKNPTHSNTDDSVLKELPANIRIYRAFSLEMSRLENWLYAKLFNKPSNGPPAVFNNPKEVPKESASNDTKKPQILKRLIFTPLRRFLQNVIHTPDDKIGWIPFAIIKGLWIIRHENIDVIFSTSPPESSHIVAMWLGRLTGKPFIADFRDPFTTHYTKKNIPALADSLPYISPRRLKIEKKIERKILTRAKYAIHTGSGRSALVKEAFPEIDPDKHQVITNGYDESDFQSLPSSDELKKPDSDAIEFVNVGQIYPDAAFGQFLDGVERALADTKDFPDIRLKFVGDMLNQWTERLSSPPLRERVDIVGFKPHKEAVRIMMQSDVLLLMLPEGDISMRDKIIAGKTFELMRSGRPILMIGWEGESSRMIQESGLGRFVPCDDLNAIARAISDYRCDKAAGKLSRIPNWDYIRQFERKALTGRLSQLFEMTEVIDKGII